MPKKKKSRLEKRYEKDWQDPTQKSILEFGKKPEPIKLIEIREEKPKEIKLIEVKPEIKLIPVQKKDEKETEE